MNIHMDIIRGDRDLQRYGHVALGALEVMFSANMSFNNCSLFIAGQVVTSALLTEFLSIDEKF
jgi:hypothetical protein